MSNSGITRRIDELGRLVIPKEIRKNLKIKDNDQIEINIVNDKIILSKYDVLKKDDIIHLLLLLIRKELNKNVLFTSREKIIDSCLLNKEKISNINLDNSLINIIENRKEVLNNDKEINLTKDINISSSLISPLIINGDLYGSLIIYSDNKINDNDTNIIKFVKTFLENYLE